MDTDKSDTITGHFGTVIPNDGTITYRKHETFHEKMTRCKTEKEAEREASHASRLAAALQRALNAADGKWETGRQWDREARSALAAYEDSKK
jgi:hypothetical protein